MPITRRTFLAHATNTALVIAPAAHAATASPAAPAAPRPDAFGNDDVILFQGDSITDANRDRATAGANEGRGLGNGYVHLTAAQLLATLAGKNPRIYNRGISGNKVFQLAERWQTDCLDLKPTVLSILVGVNDYWHKRRGAYDGTVVTYETDYRALLKRTKEALPDVRLVIGEPFALPGGTAVDAGWFPEFDAYRAVARKLAGEFGAVFVPYHDIFAQAARRTGPACWSADGVHPTLAGAALMQQAWLDHVLGRAQG